MLRYLSGQYRFMPIPRIGLIGILRYAITFHLEMRRHTNGLPIPAVIIQRLEALRRKTRILGIMEIPQPIKRAYIRRLTTI